MSRRTASDKVIHCKEFIIAKNIQCDGYKSGLVSMVYTFFDKKSFGVNTSGGAVTRANKSAKSEVIPNQSPSDVATRQLAEKVQ